MDEDHKKLVDMLNRLHDAMKQQKGNEVLGQIFKELLDYAVFHFAREEKTMAQTGYAESPDHKAKHKLLIEQAKDLQEEFKSGKKMVTVDVLAFLKDWLMNHIVKEDKKMAQYFLTKGIV